VNGELWVVGVSADHLFSFVRAPNHRLATVRWPTRNPGTGYLGKHPLASSDLIGRLVLMHGGFYTIPDRLPGVPNSSLYPQVPSLNPGAREISSRNNELASRTSDWTFLLPSPSTWSTSTWLYSTEVMRWINLSISQPTSTQRESDLRPSGSVHQFAICPRSSLPLPTTRGRSSFNKLTSFRR